MDERHSRAARRKPNQNSLKQSQSRQDASAAGGAQCVRRFVNEAPARTAQGAIRAYQLTLSAFAGRHCRYLPSCSAYASEAIGAYGLWAGGWMGLARICRCRPGGGSGYDPVPKSVSDKASALQPWRYGHWRYDRSPSD